MIIGNGNIARVLIDREDVTFFACGVSDSSCTDEKEFEREYLRLSLCNSNTHLVYFSGPNIYTKDTPYARHKKIMEQLVKKAKSYTIVRVGVLEWVNNSTTILNHYRNVIRTGKPIVYNSDDMIRHVLSLREFQYWMNLIRVGEREEMNITGRMMTVPQIIEEIKQGRL